MDKKPMISVVMSVYNGQAYLREAIDSILGQTYEKFEFIIINDGSKDDTENIVKRYDDERIRYIDNVENRGLIYSLNYGFKLAKGKYIARMDADDIALDNRFQKQVDFLEENPLIALVASNFKIIDSKGITKTKSSRKKSEKEIALSLFFSNDSIAHPTVMIRRECLWENPYETEYLSAEDYRLWSVMASKNLVMHVMPDVLLEYRLHGSNVTFQNSQTKFNSIRKIIKGYLLSIGLSPTEKELDIQTSFHCKEDTKDFEYFEMDEWLQKLYIALKVKRFEEKLIINVITNKYIYYLANRYIKQPQYFLKYFFISSKYLDSSLLNRLFCLYKVYKQKFNG